MKRLTQLSWLIGLLMLSSTAIAQETTEPEAETGTSEEEWATEPGSESADTSASLGLESSPDDSVDAELEEETESEEEAAPDSWEIFFTGYFRAPLMISFSSRADPADPTQTKESQISYAPNRLYDAGYDTFKFTRLNEEDWAEFYLHLKRPHIQASIAVMGAWYQWAAHKNPGALFTPGLAWIKLDTDFDIGDLTANIALKAGAFLQVYGYMGKYDNYLYARHHQSGETIELTLPFNENFVLRVNDGFGYFRASDGDGGFGAVPVHHLHVGATISKMLDVGLYLSNNWTKDPALFDDFSLAKDAKMDVIGADAHLNMPRFGHLWLGFSRIMLTNGTSIPGWGTEVMHSMNGGDGITEIYMPLGNGTGSVNNIGWLYENTLSGVQGLDSPSFPEITLNIFGLMAMSSYDLMAGGEGDTSSIKGGADITVHPLPWLGIMLRYDSVKTEGVDLGGQVVDQSFSVITPRIIASSHLTVPGTIYLQWSHYMYGDNVWLNEETQMKPDEDVLKLMCEIWW